MIQISISLQRVVANAGLYEYTAAWLVLPFSELNRLVCGYFDPENIFMDNESKYFSAKTKLLSLALPSRMCVHL